MGKNQVKKICFKFLYDSLHVVHWGLVVIYRRDMGKGGGGLQDFACVIKMDLPIRRGYILIIPHPSHWQLVSSQTSLSPTFILFWRRLFPPLFPLKTMWSPISSSPISPHPTTKAIKSDWPDKSYHFRRWTTWKKIPMAHCSHFQMTSGSPWNGNMKLQHPLDYGQCKYIYIWCRRLNL